MLKMASAGMIAGSGCFSLRTTCRGPRSSTWSIEPISKFQMPFFGSRARSSDHFTSSAVIGEPSENFTPSRRVRVTLVPSSATFQSVARPGCTPLPSSVGREQRVVEIGQDPDVDVGVVQHRVEEQAVGVAPVVQLAAALRCQRRLARRADKGRQQAGREQLPHAFPSRTVRAIMGIARRRTTRLARG